MFTQYGLLKRDCSLHKNRINWDEKEKQLNGHYLSFTIPLMNRLTYSICLETHFLVLRSLNASIVFMTCMLIDYICIYYILSDIFFYYYSIINQAVDFRFTILSSEHLIALLYFIRFANCWTVSDFYIHTIGIWWRWYLYHIFLFINK